MKPPSQSVGLPIALLVAALEGYGCAHHRLPDPVTPDLREETQSIVTPIPTEVSAAEPSEPTVPPPSKEAPASRGAPPPASPAPAPDCRTASTSAKESEGSGQLRKALLYYEACGAPACGPRVSRVCTTAAEKLKSEMPTIIPVVIEEQGNPRTEVKVSLDGEPLVDRITGTAVPVDVGLHEIQFRDGSDQKLLGSLKILVLEGQRNRPVTLQLTHSQSS